ncbi:MAG TPA: type VI secretion system baseplate subunit TssK [Telluria sp.]
MTTPAPVLWGEGLFLRPQHFQQQDRYHDLRLQQMASALHPYAWGVRQVEIDPEGLRNDVVRVDTLSLVFRDGETFRAPGTDILPLPLNLSALPDDAQEATIHAALPRIRPHGGNCSGADARYATENREVDDLYSRSACAQVAVLRKSLRLLTGYEPLDAYETVPIARIRRMAAGGFEADGDFLPPSMTIGSTAALYRRLARLLEKLLAKVNALYGHQREPSRHVIEIRSGDASAFWLLHTASSAHAALAHLAQHRDLHPERLYQQLLSLAGALMTFSRSYRLEDLPAYSHSDPGPAFAKLDLIVRDLLDTVISARYFSIALDNERPNYYLGALDSGKIDERASLYLAVSADMPALQLVEAVPLRFKVGAPEDVDKFVTSALPGVKISHAPQVPSALPVRPDTCYFSIDSRGPLYEAMLKAQAISIYVPAGIAELRLELVAVLP